MISETVTFYFYYLMRFIFYMLKVTQNCFGTLLKGIKHFLAPKRHKKIASLILQPLYPRLISLFHPQNTITW